MFGISKNVRYVSFGVEKQLRKQSKITFAVKHNPCLDSSVIVIAEAKIFIKLCK